MSTSDKLIYTAVLLLTPIALMLPFAIAALFLGGILELYQTQAYGR